MRWTRKVIWGLLAALTICLGVYIYTAIAPILAAMPKQHLATALIRDLLSPQQPWVVQVYPWLLLGLGGPLLFFINLDMKTRRRTTHGSARHATRREVSSKYRAERERLWPRLRSRRVSSWFGRAARRGEQRLELGTYYGKAVTLSEEQQTHHMLLTAPTGGGKSKRVFIPNLLREEGNRSLFIADLKNELYRITGGWLAQHMPVWRFAPTHPQESCHYNPLAHIHSVEQAQDFAEAWVANTGTDTRTAFWETNSKLLISAMALHLLATERTPAFSRLSDVCSMESYEAIRDLLRSSPSLEARRIVGQFLENMEKNERQVGSQMTDLGNRFQLLASTAARSVTATNDLDFREMIDTPTAFFLSIPATATKRYRPLLAVLVQQMFAAWEGGTKGVACYLDEFANLGHLPGFTEFITLARDQRVGLFLAIQTFSQLEERYGKAAAQTIRANCVTELLLPGAGLEETRYYSERIGDTTIRTETITRRGSGMAAEVTSSEGETHRRLMTADELRRMATDEMLMISGNAPALLLRTTYYLDDKTLAQRANLPPTTRVRVTPTGSTGPHAPRPAQQGLPPGSAGAPRPIIVDADDPPNTQFFQGE